MGIARKQIRWNGWGWTAHQDALAERESVWRWLAGELGMPALLATPARALEDCILPAPSLTAQQIAGFTAILGADRVTQDDYERAFHARGRSYTDLIALRAGDLSGAPDAILYPRGEDEVLALLQLAAREKIAVVPFGGGAGTDVAAGPGRITIDLSGMDQLLAVDSQAGTAIAEAGIYGPALEKALAARGLALGHASDNFEFSSLGGWIAASRSVDWLLGLRLATPQGILNTDAIAGPDLKHLVAGSQGIFGIITQARIKVRTAVTPLDRAFLFGDFTSGAAALREALRAEIPHALLRLSDAEETSFERTLAELEAPRGFLQRIQDAWAAARQSAPGVARLIASFPDADAASRFEKFARKHGARAQGEAPARDWLQNRFQAAYARDAMLDRGVGVDGLEATASWSALPTLYGSVSAALDRAMRDNAPRPGAHGLVLGHIDQVRADGARLNFRILFPRQLENEIAQSQAIRKAALDVINDSAQKDALGLAALRGLKAALDPEGIMNPGKLIS